MVDPSMRFLESTMDMSALKRKTIADNIANYNTPDFKASKVLFDAQWKEGKTGLKTTNEKHIRSEDNQGVVVEKKSGTKERYDGNNVDLQEEMLDMIKNNYVFSTSVQALNKKFMLTKIAIGN